MRWRSSPFRGRFLTRGEFQSEICRDAGGSDVVKLYILVLFNVFRTENCFLQVSSYIKHKSTNSPEKITWSTVLRRLKHEPDTI